MTPQRRLEILAEQRFLERHKRSIESRLAELTEILRLFPETVK